MTVAGPPDDGRRDGPEETAREFVPCPPVAAHHHVVHAVVFDVRDDGVRRVAGLHLRLDAPAGRRRALACPLDHPLGTVRGPRAPVVTWFENAAFAHGLVERCYDVQYCQSTVERFQRVRERVVGHWRPVERNENVCGCHTEGQSG